MLKAIKYLEQLQNKLDSDKSIYKYRVKLNLDTTITVDIVTNNNSDKIIKELNDFEYIHIYVDEIITKDEYENDEYYRELFKNQVDYSLKKRLSNLFSDFDKRIDINTPIVSFYSYKGGVGRTTSLVAFANYVSYHFSKKVVILDFDFEAPGLINYFDFSLENLNKNGIVEYILDKQASKEKLNLIENYIIEVSKTYSGDGSIYVMPSGNIFDNENLDSYIEGLARIDINGTYKIVSQINDMLLDIKKAINPDIILVDSRTGFNDIFGLLVHNISSLVVGFFEDNIQTQPGIRMFLNELYTKESNVNTLLVNSLVHKNDRYSKRFESFKNTVESITSDINDDMMNIPMLELREQSILGNLGTSQYDKDDYMDFIKSSVSNDYRLFFEKLLELIEEKDYNKEEPKDNDVVIDNNIIISKKKLLQKLYDNFPSVYAEGLSFDEKFLKNEFFFRKCMEDIFNYDKILLIGGKGTGKTAFYNALKNKNFVNHLLKKSNKSQIKFSVIDIVSLQEDKQKQKYIEISSFLQDEIKDTEYFYTRFWKIYIMNSILLDSKKINYTPQYTKSVIMNNSIENMMYIKDIIYDDKKMNNIEKELQSIDKHLKMEDTNLLITFDQLDYISKPILWNNAIAPLIKYFRTNPFIKIIPKLFVRRDLFQKLSNLTNKEALENKSINLEWNKDEIFSFFFKIVFANSKDDFFQIMQQYNFYDSYVINKIKKQIRKINSYNQVPIEDNYIKPLVETFFGKYASANGQYYDKKYGTTYDWFYKSLMNADGTISIRPFLDLIRFSIETSISNAMSKQKEKPILPAYYFTAKAARNQSVERHFKDLADETGNEDLKIIIQYIKNNTTFPKRFRQRVLKGNQYEDFLQYIIDNVEQQQDKSKNDIENILRINGIINIEYIHGNLKKCSFAYLYKYYLGLRG